MSVLSAHDYKPSMLKTRINKTAHLVAKLLVRDDTTLRVNCIAKTQNKV